MSTLVVHRGSPGLLKKVILKYMCVDNHFPFLKHLKVAINLFENRFLARYKNPSTCQFKFTWLNEKMANKMPFFFFFLHKHRVDSYMAPSSNKKDWILCHFGHLVLGGCVKYHI